MQTNAHIDRQTTTIEGVTFTNMHSGQKRAYGDTIYEYDVTSDMPADHVERICREHAYKCDLSAEQYKAQYAADRSAGNFFRTSYEFKRTGNGTYSYRVTYPFTD